MVKKSIKDGFKQTEVGIIPEEWQVQNILDNSILKARIGWQGLTTAEYRTNGKFYLVTGTDFLNGKINWETCVYVNKKRYDQDINIQLKTGDILVIFARLCISSVSQSLLYPDNLLFPVRSS